MTRGLVGTSRCELVLGLRDPLSTNRVERERGKRDWAHAVGLGRLHDDPGSSLRKGGSDRDRATFKLDYWPPKREQLGAP